ncbi:hypothetical protein ACFVJ4_37555 [Streptomyces sp. NPDC127178]|uniref:hypothetical protein n=1 Tax=unclassified Streptomyces TaxID=2593676 RepID=UPI00362D8A32
MAPHQTLLPVAPETVPEISHAVNGRGVGSKGAANSDSRIAILSHGEDAQPPLLRWNTLNVEDGPRSLPGVSGAHFVPLDAQCGGARSRHEEKCRHASMRAASRLDRVAALFGCGYPADSGSALCFHVGNEQNMVAFVEARFARSQPQYLHVKGAKALPAEGIELNRVNFKAGPCLFSERTVRFFDEAGEQPNILAPTQKPFSHRLTRIWADPELSLYEYEAVLRQTRAIADVASAAPPGARLTVTIDIPRVQYYLYLMDAFRHHLASPGLLLEWFDLVDLRHDRMVAFFRERLHAELKEVMRDDVSVHASDALGAVDSHIRDAIARNTLPRLESLLDDLAVAGDEAWTFLLNTEPPQDLAALGTSSYVVEALRTAGIHDNGTNLGIHVENYSEWKMLHRTERVLDRARRAGRQTSPGILLGTYPLERMINISPSGHPANPYFLDPGRRAVDDRGNEIDLFDAVDTLYA